MTFQPDPHLLPHENLLRACAVSQHDEAARRAVDLALSAPDLDWKALALASVRHGVMPHVARHLNAFTNDPRIPAEFAACFARMGRGIALRNRVLFRETARLLRALEAASIGCLVLKGVGLALTVYPDPALRNFADIDILVEEADYEAAGEIAAQCGFVRDAIAAHPWQHHEAFIATCPEDILTDTVPHEYDPMLTPELLIRHRHEVSLELHRGLFLRANGFMRDVDLAPFWEGSQAAALPDGTPMRVPSPEAQIVHLAAHAATHIFRKLLFGLDMARVIATYREQIDWERVIALADRYEAGNDTYLLLDLAQSEFGAEAPAATLHRLRRETDAGRSGPRLTPAHIFQAAQKDQSAENLERLRRASNGWERLATAWHILFPPVPAMQRIYGAQPPSRIALYYLLRPFHLLLRQGRALLRRIRPQSRTALPEGEYERSVRLPVERSH
ncbi:MAG TPA: nucleotidyltransferase family protein [Chthonomonadaceae bacterium]|nr:nucleotidyltransferase family protein [Chthonomonadaceae bacterium]